jgi:hypothetical protein
MDYSAKTQCFDVHVLMVFIEADVAYFLFFPYDF